VYELGSKWLWFDGDLAFRTALYHATKDWERNTDLESTASILTKKRHSNGLEFELAGRITEQWEIFAGMSFIKAAIDEVAVNRNATTGIETSANSNFEGQFPRNTPRRTLNLWNTYKVSGEWKLGLGFEAKDERTGYNPSSTGTAGFDPNHIPGYVRTDLLVSYEKQKVQVDLLIKNAFNKTYFDAFYDNGGFAIPGDERRVSLSVKYTF
jgi:catecholate siderophore receptor